MSELFVPQADGSRYQWLNCTCASDAMWLFRATGGSVRTSGAEIRRLTGDRNEGTTLAQMDEVNTFHFGMPCQPAYGMDIDTLWDMIRAGRGAIIQYSYAPLIGTRWASSRYFRGNHASYVPKVGHNLGTLGDPLADGRLGFPKGFQGDVPLSLLREACGELVTRTDWKGHPTARVGSGRVYAMLTSRDTKPTFPPARVTTTAPDLDGDNAMVTYSQVTDTLSLMFLAKGQPLYKSTSTQTIVTRMSKAGYVKHVGLAGKGWRAVQVGTGTPYVDKHVRPTIVYVPAAAGTVVD